MSGGGGGGEQEKKAPSAAGGGADEFGRAVARVAVAQMLEAGGFHGAHRSAVDALVDVLVRYVSHLGKAAAFHANLAGRVLANEYDIIQGLEELDASHGFVGASTSNRCLVSSGAIKEIATFVSETEEVPFARPLPKFPIPRSAPQLVVSFAVAGKEPGMKHVPEWLPAFPDPHTYVRTEVWNEKAAEPGADKVEQARQRRKAEKSLLSLQQRLALAGADGFAPTVEVDAEKGKQVVGSNPFLEPALLYGGKEVSEIAVPKEGGSERKKLSVLEAFAPAIEAVKNGKLDGGTGQDQNQNQKSIVPKERAPVHLRIGIDRKSVVAAVNSRALHARKDSWSLKEEGKDDRKRRAEMILREAMENPQELTQL